MKRTMFVPLLAPLFTAQLALAQTDQTGVIAGQLIDAQGQPVVAADVVVARPDGSYRRQTISENDGTFRLGFLPPGSYDLTVTAIGYRTTELNGIIVRAARVTNQRIMVEAAPVQIEGITVLAQAELIDRTTTEYESTLESEQIELLPISRTATDLIQFTPGARPNQVWGGSTSQANSYQLDGVSVNDPGFGGDFLLPNVDWIEEVVVKGLGAGAEYGNFQGGLLNIVTKSGSNTRQGAIRFNYQDQGLNAQNVNAFEAGAELDNRWEINGELRGPIIGNKLYYFVSGQYEQSDTRVVDTQASSDTNTDSLVFFDTREKRELVKLLGKLTWQATEKDIFNASMGKDDVYTDNRGLNSFDSPETVTKQESPATFYSASWQRQFDTRNLLEVKFTGWSGRDDRLPLFGDRPSVQYLFGDRNTFRNSIFTRTREPSNAALAVNWDSYWRTGSIEHQLKIGGEYGIGWWDERRARNGNLTWRPDEDDPDAPDIDPEDPATWDFISSDWGGDINLDAKNVNAGLYIQDYMRVNDHLLLNPGLRLGRWEGKITPGDVSGGEFTAMKDWGLAPRIGLNYDLFADGEWVAKGHWGRYFQNMFALFYDRVEGANVFSDTEYWDWDAADDPDINRAYTLAERDSLFVFFDDDPASSEVGPVVNYSQPYVDQFVVGLEKAFGPQLKVGALYVNRRNKNIIALVDRNLSSNYQRLENISIIDFRAGEPVLDQEGNPLVLDTVYVSNRDVQFVGEFPGLTPEQIDALSFEQDFVITPLDDAQRKFDQIQIFFESYFDTWQLRGSLAWTDLRGNFFSVNGYEDPGGTGAGAFVEPNKQINFLGALPNYSDWEVKLQGTVNLPLSLRSGVFLTYRSGDHYAPTYTIDRRNHDFVTAAGETLDPDLFFDVSGEDIFLETRGSRELDSVFRVDLHFDWAPTTTYGRWVLALDIFNLFNTNAVTDLKSSVNDQIPGEPTTFFGAPRFREIPRSLRLTTSFRF